MIGGESKSPFFMLGSSFIEGAIRLITGMFGSSFFEIAKKKRGNLSIAPLTVTKSFVQSYSEFPSKPHAELSDIVAQDLQNVITGIQTPIVVALIRHVATVKCSGPITIR